MASLENKKIKDTYEGLLKTDDNAAIDGAVEITDGAGNGTGVTISNDGQVTTTGTVSFGSLKDTGEDITVTKFVDEADGIGNNDNDTSVPTSAAVKDYVDTNVTAQDLDFQGDSGTGAVDLDSQSLDIAGGTGIDTSAVDQTLTVNIDSTVATLTGTQTLTNKSIDLTDNTLSGTTAEFNTALSDDDFATLAGTETLTNKTVDADNNTVSNLEVDNLKSGVLDTDLTSVSASDDTLASAKAIKTYVDSNITAQDLDITDGTTTSAVDLDSQTLTIEGTANEVEVSLTDQTFTVGLPTSITTNVTGNLTGNVTGNVTGDVTGNADTASALETARTISLSGDVAGSVSFDGSANADITATIQANSVALGTDTTGDYVSGLGVGTGVTIGSNTGEGSSPTISVDYGSTANTAVQGDTSLTIQGTANEIEVTGGAVTLGSGGTVTVGLPDDVSLGGSLTIAQNLTVNGTTTTVNTDTLSVEDPLIELARDNSENSVDVGLYGKYSLDSGVTTKYSGLFKDASDSDKFKLFKGLEVEPTSTVDTSGTGYTKGDLIINDLDAVTISGTISTAAQTNITSVGTLSSLSVSGDLTVDTNTLYVDSSNNRVGIGTSSPADPFHLSMTNGDIRIDAETDRNHILSRNAGNSDWRDICISASSGQDQLVLDTNGRVGINTSSPTEALDVRGSVKIGKSGTSPYLTFDEEPDSGSGSEFYLTHDILGNILKFTDDNSNNLIAMDRDTGYVGIGTLSPSEKLDVSGTIQSSANEGKIIINSTATNGKEYQLISIDSGNLGLFDGAAYRLWVAGSGSVGIGTTSPSNGKLQIDSTGNQISIETGTSGDGRLQIGHFSNGTFIGTYGDDGGAADVIRFGTHSGDERMRIDSSGNVGIGTSSPASGISTNSKTIHIAHSNIASISLDNTNQNTKIELASADISGGALTIRKNTSSGTSGATELMRIDSSGRVGIGLTPYTTSSLLNLKGDGLALKNDENGGDNNWSLIQNLATGTQSSIDFTTGQGLAMTISHDKNVGIGTSSPDRKLQISATNAAITNPLSVGNALRFTDDDPTQNNGQITGTIEWETRDSNSAGVQSYITTISTNTGLGNLAFGTGGGGSATERMRITSGGAVLIGTTDADPINSNLSGVSLSNSFRRFHSTSSEATLSVGTSSANLQYFFYNSGTTLSVVGTITTNGSSTAYNTSSDYRLKENVVDLTGALDRVDQLEPKRFNFIADEDTTVDGFLAHEVQDIVPEAVTGDKDAVDEDGNDIYQGIDQSKLVPLLVGAIKELNAKVAALEAQINN